MARFISVNIIRQAPFLLGHHLAKYLVAKKRFIVNSDENKELEPFEKRFHVKIIAFQPQKLSRDYSLDLY